MRWGPHLRGADPGMAGHREREWLPQKPQAARREKAAGTHKEGRTKGESGEKGGRKVKGGENVQTRRHRGRGRCRDEVQDWVRMPLQWGGEQSRKSEVR